MSQTKSFDGSHGKGMHKAALPWGGVDSSNPRHRRGWQLHRHGGVVCLVICAFLCAFWLVTHELYSSYLRFMCYIVSHPGLHLTRVIERELFVKFLKRMVDVRIAFLFCIVLDLISRTAKNKMWIMYPVNGTDSFTWSFEWDRFFRRVPIL